MPVPPPDVPATPWLAPPAAQPGESLAQPGAQLATTLLAWLKADGGPSRLEWEVDALPGGRLESALRCPGGSAEDLALLAAAAGEALTPRQGPVARPPPRLRYGVDLGAPVAWFSRRALSGDSPVARARWLAERGMRLRLALRVWPLTPLLAAQKGVERRREGLANEPKAWDPEPHEVASAERLLDGFTFEMTIGVEKVLSAAERIVIEHALRSAFTPRARLAELPSLALAERDLAEALVREFSTARAETAEESEGAAEAERILAALK